MWERNLLWYIKVIVQFKNVLLLKEFHSKKQKKKTNKIFIHSQTELGPQLHESKNDLLVEVILITRTSVVSLTPKFFLINIKI